METVTDHRASLPERVKAWYAENPLRRWRKRNGLSMMQAASTIGIGMSAIQSWEQGAHQPNDESMARMASAMKLQTATLARKWRVWYADRPTS